jgi:DNA-directed RNA polymerase subunit K/omega
MDAPSVVINKREALIAARAAEFRMKTNAQRHVSYWDPVRDAAREIANKKIATCI